GRARERGATGRPGGRGGRERAGRQGAGERRPGGARRWSEVQPSDLARRADARRRGNNEPASGGPERRAPGARCNRATWRAGPTRDGGATMSRRAEARRGAPPERGATERAGGPRPREGAGPTRDGGATMRLRHVVGAFPALFRVGLMEAFAYRAEFFVWMLTTTMPLVMMALWTAVAAEAPFQGFGPGDFVAYYLAALIV